MIDWLTQSFADCPPTTEWLNPAERARLGAFKIEKRRREWLLGRWTAKRLVQRVIHQATSEALPLDAFAIRNDADSAPRVVWEVSRAPQAVGLWELPLSLSHSGERALCATGPGRVGADIERIEARTPELVSDFFTRPEAALVEGAPASRRNELITLIWSAKEAVLKALHLGLTVDTRVVTCLLDLEAQSEWRPFSVRFDPHWFAGPALCGWWQTVEGYGLTIVTERPQAEQAESFLPRIRKLFGRQ